MDKLLIFLKRKPGISFEQFRDYYEQKHIPLAERFFGHLIKSYTRNYLTPGDNIGPVLEKVANEYDCVTELVFHDPDGYQQLRRIADNPEVINALSADREHFMDEAAGYNAPAQVFTSRALPS
jgi:hypothetical protein